MSAHPAVLGQPARILIVDDERNNRALLEVMLRPEGFQLQTASSGEEALALVEQQKPDLILLDVMMPGMDGYAVVKKLKGDLVTNNIPIIIVSAVGDRDARMLGLSAGAEDFLTKPVDRLELTMRVRNLLRLKAYGDLYDKYSQVLEGQVSSRTADLIESERLYRSTFDAAPVGIVHVGLDGQWLRVNKRVCDLLGYSGQELSTPAVQSLMQSERDIADDAAALRQITSRQLDHHVVDERRYRRRDGAFVWVRINTSAYRDAVGQSQQFISVIEDITERRTLDARVRQANKMEAIGGLASGIAHDFNNLLSVVLGYSQLLGEELTEGDPMRADLAEIRAAGLRAVDLTRQLLAFSRQQVLEPKVVHLGEVVIGMEKMLRRLLGEDVDLISTCTHASGKIVVDPSQVEQVIMNLAINARDAMPRGGRLLIETSDVTLDPAYASAHDGVTPGPHVALKITDTGVGMDAETQTRIFEPFFTTKPVGQGTGLGLATVFGIVQQSGGTIHVHSEQGVGTTFTLHFPRVTRALDEVCSLPPAEVSALLRGAETILLVEDDESVRVLVRTILRKYGYDVLEAQSGGDAFLLCEQHAGTIHLLLTDVVMPRMSGRQLAERLNPLRPTMEVLYMSGHMDDQVMRYGIVQSTIAFIQKPITPEALARKVRSVLDSKERARMSIRAAH